MSIKALALKTLYCTALVSHSVLAQSVGFHVVEPLPGHTSTLLFDVSADGAVGVGSSANDAMQIISGIRVDSLGVAVEYPRVPFGNLPTFVSGDGRFAAGTGVEGPIFDMQFSYRRAGFAPAERLTAVPSRVGGINGNGSVIVGGQQIPFEPFVSRYAASRWTVSGGFQTLISPTDPNIITSFSSGVSADGNVVCGTYVRSDTELFEAFRWSVDRGLEVLPYPSTRPDAAANAISGDGLRIVGFAPYADGYHNVMWTNGQIIDLGPQGPASGSPTAVSDSGVVLLDYNNLTREAQVWTAALGRTVSLTQYIESFGFDVPNGWVLYDAAAVSDDGRTIAGSALLPDQTVRGFIVTVPATGVLPALGIAVAYSSRRRRR